MTIWAAPKISKKIYLQKRPSCRGSFFCRLLALSLLATNSACSTNLMKKIGLIIVWIGFGVWFYTLSLNKFILSETILAQIIQPEHRSTLGQSLQPMIDRTYTNGWSFAYSFQQKIDNLNSQYRAKQQWDKVIYDDEYTFRATKAAAIGPLKTQPWLWFGLSLGLIILGAILFFIPDFKQPEGIKNNGIFHQSTTARGWIAWFLAAFLVGFYIILYYKPHYLTNWTLIIDPISRTLNGSEASRWFLYGFLYTLSVLLMGIRMLIKYKHSRYQKARTLSVMFFQTAFAFIIPEILISLQLPYFDFKNMWPLDYDFFFDWNLNNLMASGHIGIFMLVWGILLFVVGVPVMTYFFGKRWYCSWVCGCGGLAETLGDPYRQLSNKSLKAWQIERYVIHTVFVLAVLMTALVLFTYFTGQSSIGFIDSYYIRSLYGFWIGGIFAGVIGTGLYPIMGNRVWCRFGCPLAAYLGFWQKTKSRFRITTNGGQCISCGNCSTYCEMGIDVRAYAQKGQDIVRSSCVGCGVCSAVCPRGVLNLENAAVGSRVTIAPNVLLGNDMNQL
jgi:ferredoxin-type protein NapH